MSDIVLHLKPVLWLWTHRFVGERPCGFYISKKPPEPTDRVYIAAEGKLQGWFWVDTIITMVASPPCYCVMAHQTFHPVTIADPVPGFAGWRHRWWETSAEKSAA